MRQVKQIWEIALDRRREEQVQASMRAKVKRGPKVKQYGAPPVGNVTVSVCEKCGGRVELRPGLSHAIHVGTRFGHCPAGAYGQRQRTA